MCQSELILVSEGPPPIRVSPEVMSHVVDVHCHPTDSPLIPEVMDGLHIRLCAMATRGTDQALVRGLAAAYPDTVTPAFGYHPWFTHWIAVKPFISKEDHYKELLLSSSSKAEHAHAFKKLLSSLPEPTPLSDILIELRDDLTACSDAFLGEVGLDRACRIPFGLPSAPPYATDETKRELSPFTIPITHQLTVLEAQLDLAVALRRNVSFHSVKCQQATVELLDKLKTKHGDAWSAISICMHSCGLSPQTWKDIEKKHSNIYMSLSVVINSRSPTHRDLIAACSANHILVESDYHDPSYSTGQTWKMLQIVAEVKGWTVEDTWEENILPEQWGVVRKLEHNWKMFKEGSHQPVRKRDKRKLLLEDWESDEGDKEDLK